MGGPKRAGNALIHHQKLTVFCFVFLIRKCAHLLSCQPRVTVASFFVNKVIRDLESIDHLCINPTDSR